MKNEFVKKCAEADLILVSKGENRSTAECALTDLGILMPDFPGRCLHGGRR